MINRMCNFVNLHVHTAYSLLDGMSKPEDVVDKVKRLKQPAIAITEHGNVYSAVKMYKLCKENDIKFIYGCEMYITENRFVKDHKNKYWHLTVLAKNEQGRVNINKLVTLSNLEGFYYKPRIDHELLQQYKDGLIVLSGCMASELQRTLAEKGYEAGKEVARKYRSWLGENYYLEVQSHRDEHQQRLNRMIVDIGKELGIPWVVTSDSHYVDEDDFELHSIFIQIGTNREAGETYQDTQIQSEEEARKLLKPALTDEEIDLAIRNTLYIMDKCNVDVPISAPLIPHVKVPNGFADENEYLKHLCRQGWIRRGLNKLPENERIKYKERLQYEFDAIKEMGFAGYFLLVEDYVNSAKRKGLARGSSAGSLISYLLNIVDVDPIRFGLYFERFIDVSALDLLKEGKITPKELKIPDVDTDFGSEEREKVLQHIVDTYGKDRVTAIGSFQYIWAKTAIKDVGRVLGLPFSLTDQITKEIDEAQKGSEDKIKTVQEARELGLLGDWEDKYPELFKYAEKLAGLPRSFSMHPCGKVVTIDEATQYTALEENDGEMVLQMDMDDCEALGLVKIDTLGLNTIDIIWDVLEKIGKGYEYIDPNKHDFKDEKVLNIFRNGYTDGIFQFESNGMKDVLKKIHPSGLDDLAVANALYRPGAMKFIDVYCDRKHGREEVRYLHPDLEPILKPTYGIIVYQEQLIEIGRLAGLRNPDEIRKATAKKKAKLMAKVEPELKEGLKKRGWTQEQVDELWTNILDFAKYSFNKSHSYAYAITAYITAKLKAYHPVEFICSALNRVKKSGDKKLKKKKANLVSEALRMGIKFIQPSFRTASGMCEIIDGKLQLGTHFISGCNANVGEQLKQFVDNEYDYFVELLADIVENTNINSKQLTGLIRSGYFSEFGGEKTLLQIYDQFSNGKGVKYDKKLKSKAKRLEMLKEIEESIIKNNNEEYSIYEKVKTQLELYDFAYSTFDNFKLTDVVVVDVEAEEYKGDVSKLKVPKLHIRQLKTGKEVIVKVKKGQFYLDNGSWLINEGDLLRVLHTEKERGWKKDENGKWVQTDRFDTYLYSCLKLN